jgi:hypothetical protein
VSVSGSGAGIPIYGYNKNPNLGLTGAKSKGTLIGAALCAKVTGNNLEVSIEGFSARGHGDDYQIFPDKISYSAGLFRPNKFKIIHTQN